MYCPECGTNLPEGSQFCGECGTHIATDAADIPAGEPYQPAGTSMAAEKKNQKVIIIAVICIAAIVLGWFAINAAGKASLQKQLLRDWSRVEADDDFYYTLELDFSDSYFDYNYESTYIDSTIATFDYKVVSRNKIRIDELNTTYTITFNDDKDMMIMSPALTESAVEEYWYYH